MHPAQLPPQKENVKHIIWIHAIEIVLIWLSPILISWWLIIIGIGLYYLQILIFGDCVMTRRQFKIKKRGVTFYYFILVKLGFKPDMYKVRWVADYVMPYVILVIALILQLSLHFQPLIF